MASDHHQEKQPKKLDHGVRDMVSSIMGRIPDLHKPGGSSQRYHDDDERGVQVVTLAGNNLGASLKTDQPDDQKSHVLGHPDGVFFGEDGQSDTMSTYVNSNFQAINNSIMMGGKYEDNDPGVHLEITDLVEHNKGKFHKHGKKGKKNKKEKEKEKEKEGSSSSDEDSEGAELREHKGHMKGKNKKEGDQP